MHCANGWNERRVSETSALMNAELELAVAQHNLEAAQLWLGIWAQVDPDNRR